MKKNSLFILSLASLFFLSTHTLAQDADEAPPEELAEHHVACPARPPEAELQRDLAGAWFAQGQAFAKDKHLVQALDAFLCSMSMFEHESTLHNVRKSADLVEDKFLVVQRLEAYVADAPEGPLTDKVQAMIDSEKEKLALPEPERESEHEPAVAVEPSSGFSWKIPAYVSFGVGGLAFLQAIVFQSLASSKGNSADEEYGDERTMLNQASEIYQTQATWSFVVAGIVGGGGALLYFYDKKISQKDQEPSKPAPTEKVANLRVLPSFGGLSLSGTF